MPTANVWPLLEAQYRDQPQMLVQAHMDSYNDFLSQGLPSIFRQHNPVVLSTNVDASGTPLSQCQLFVGGKEGLRFDLVHVTSDTHTVIPNEARLRNLTYAVSLYVDVDVEITEWLRPDQPEPEYARFLVDTKTVSDARGEDEAIVIRRQVAALEDDDVLEDVFRKRVREELVRHTTEKRKALDVALASIETSTAFVAATVQKTYRTTLKHILVSRIPLMVQSDRCTLHRLTAEMRFGLGECRQDVGGYLIIDGKEKFAPLQWNDGVVANDDAVTVSRSSNHGGVDVTFGNGSAVVPLFVVFRALGIESDKEIIEYIVLDLETHDDVVDALKPCVYHCSNINTRKEAFEAFSCLTSCLPAAGLTPYALGYKVFELFQQRPFPFPARRLEAIGAQLHRAFQQEWSDHVQHGIKEKFEQHIFQNHDYKTNLYALIQDHAHEIFRAPLLLLDHCRQLPTLCRTSFVSFIQDLRTLGLQHDDSSGKEPEEQQEERQEKNNATLYGYVDPFDHSLAMSAIVSRACSKTELLDWIKEHWSMESLDHFRPRYLADMTKVRINGSWVGVLEADPRRCIERFRIWRHNGLLPPSISCTFFPEPNRIDLWCDAGRLMRPLLHRSSSSTSSITSSSWNQALTGTHAKRTDVVWDPLRIYKSLNELYDTTETNPNKLARFDKERGVLELLDEYESSMAWIAAAGDGTHAELHDALSLGYASQHVAYIEHQSAHEIGRRLQSMKRIVSMYSTHPSMRVDPESALLVSGQTPAVQSRLLELLPTSATTLGHNVVIAISGGGGGGGAYLNQGSVQRGLFAHVKVQHGHDDNAAAVGSSVICTTTEDGAPLLWSHNTQWVSADTGSVISTRGSSPVSMRVLAEADMPFLKDGSRPDVLISEHNVALLYELFVGKFATVMGAKGQSTPFDNDVYASLGGMGRLLTAMGFHSSGNAILYDGQTGKQIETEVYVGIGHAMKQDASPLQIRRRGLRHGLTRQATEDGALLEDVDVLALLSHGLCATTQDALLDRGDGYDMAICNVTGTPAIHGRNVWFSPAVDGPVTFLEDQRVDFVSSDAGRRPFSTVRVPYAYKLLAQELQTMGMQMRTITDDQVDQSMWLQQDRQSVVPQTKVERHANKKKTTDHVVDYHNVMHLLDSKETLGGAKKPKKEEQPETEAADDTVVLEDVIELNSDEPTLGEQQQQDPVVGDRVCLQGVTDGHVARPWQIVRIGDAFITLRALDTINLPVKDQIRVVPKTEIIPETHVLQQWQQQQQQQQQQQWLSPPPLFQQQQPPQGLVLNIAPKFVNGPDQSQEVVGPPPPQQQPMLDMNATVTTTPAFPTPAFMPRPIHHSPAPDKDAPIDFSKGLVIVKKQS